MRSRDLIKLMASETGIPDYSDSSITYWKNAQGQYHRDFGPAIVRADGTQEWWRNGKRHREDGPAYVSGGIQSWWRNDKRHREDGPALVWPDGTGEWWIDGKYIR